MSLGRWEGMPRTPVIFLRLRQVPERTTCAISCPCQGKCRPIYYVQSRSFGGTLCRACWERLANKGLIANLNDVPAQHQGVLL